MSARGRWFLPSVVCLNEIGGFYCLLAVCLNETELVPTLTFVVVVGVLILCASLLHGRWVGLAVGGGGGKTGAPLTSQ